jgi:hypothetical protein
METNPKEIQFFPKQKFDDTMMKTIVRWLFNTLNALL